ncbi:AAA family ATPase [Streptomyces sp. NPDC047085]|uniref:ATP-binding protein n=1 Tax=Streptomyces sp. NPDC047085 TaxID=3155140 RepID=UPI0034057C16
MGPWSGAGTAGEPEEIFAGRARELGELLEAIEWAAVGGTGAIVLRGEPGSGKSRLLGQALDALRARGRHVLSVGADPLGASIPYGALTGALCTGRRSLPSRLTAELLAALDLVPQEGHQGVHTAAARLFSILREDAPTVVCLDDLRFVDEDTIVLVGQLMRRRGRHPLVITGALRRLDPPPADALCVLLERLGRDRQLRMLDLEPMSGEDIAALLAAALPHPASPDLTELVHRHSGGNAHLALQTVRGLAEGGRLVLDAAEYRAAGSEVPLSADRRLELLRRMLATDPQVIRVAQAAALLGSMPIARIALVAELAGQPLHATEAAFDRLVHEGVLRRSGHDGYDFAHPVVRDALYHQIGPAERRRGHRTAAAWLMALPASPALDAEIAVHVRETAEFGDEGAIAVLSREASRAFAVAPRAAIPWYHRALALTPPEHSLRHQLTTRLTRALFVDGRLREAMDAGGSPAREPLPGGAKDMLTALVVGALMENAEFRPALALLDKERAAGADSLFIAAQAAHLYTLEGRPAEAEAAAAEAEARLGQASRGEQIDALAYLAHMRCVAGAYGALPPLVARLKEAAAGADRPGSRLHALSTLSFLFAMQGDTRACMQSLDEAHGLLAVCGWNLFRAPLVLARAQTAAHTGQWQAALSEIDSAAEDLLESGSLSYVAMLRGIQASIHAHRGEWSTGRRAAEAAASDHRTLAAVAVGAHAELDFMRGDLDAARRRLRTYASQPALPAHVRARMLVRLADVEAEAAAPEAVARLLEEAADSGMDAFDHPGFADARLAHGRATGDVDALREAAGIAERHSLALLRGKAHLYLGSADVDAERNLHQAVEVFHALGAVPWRRRAGAELRRRNLKVPRHRAEPTTLLTATETQIARLVQLGQGNRQIALALSLSIKTVERYLSRIYVKTGRSGRLELARALDQGLLD